MKLLIIVLSILALTGCTLDIAEPRHDGGDWDHNTSVNRSEPGPGDPGGDPGDDTPGDPGDPGTTPGGDDGISGPGQSDTKGGGKSRGRGADKGSNGKGHTK